jgi:sortase (surface protein transpeptidase)
MADNGAPTDDGARRRRWVVWSAGATVVVLVAALLLALGLRDDSAEQQAAAGDQPRAVATSPSASTPPASSAAPSPVSTPTAKARRNGMTVTVPAVGVRAKVLPLKPQGGVLDPPTLNDAYLIENYGLPGSQNTVYIAGHSWDTGKAVFNPLFDIRAQRTEVEPGDEVVVTAPEATYTYVVERSERYPRPTLDRQREVWEIVPGRLVLITCFQPDDGGEAEDNLIVYATLQEATAA